MNVCILSMQRVVNMGSVLQAYGLRKAIESLGHSVEFIDIKPNADDNNVLQKYIKRDQEPINFDKYINRYTACKVIHKIQFIKQKKYIENFMCSQLQLNSDSNEKHYDYCVIGSDEVFSCLNPWADYGFTSQLFGNVDNASHVITYAASCGVTKYNDVPSEVVNIIRESFKNISHFSVRDENTADFVFHITGVRPKVYLDPVLITDFSQEVSNITTLPEKLPKHYCAVYAYGNRISDPKEIEAIKAFCKNKHLELIAVGFAQHWINRYIPLEPFQIFPVIENADFVITDTFHGAIFSAKYASRFAIIVRDNNKNKLLDLVNRVGIQDHLWQDDDQLELIYQCKADREHIDNLLALERCKTMEYLDSAIK